MNVRDIIDDYLEANGYTGLVNMEIPCGCVAGDLAICDGECMNLAECEAGYVHYCDDCLKEIREECTVDGCPCAGGYCVGPEKVLHPREPEPLPEPWITDAKLQDAVEFCDGYAAERMVGTVKIINPDHHGLMVLVEGHVDLVEVTQATFIRIVKPVLAPDTKEGK